MKSKSDRIEEALLRTRRTAPEFAPGGRWQNDVMRDIRRLAGEAQGPDWLALFDRLVWRVAPALAMLCIAFFAVSLYLGGSAHAVLAQALFLEPGTFTTELIGL